MTYQGLVCAGKALDKPISRNLRNSGTGPVRAVCVSQETSNKKLCKEMVATEGQ